MNKITFGDLSGSLKFIVVAGYIMAALYILFFMIGFVGGFYGL